MIAKFELEMPLDFGKRVITSWESEIPQMHSHSIMHGRPPLPHALLSSWVFFLTHHSFTLGISREAGASCVFSFTFLVVFLIFPMARRSFL